MKTVSDIAQDPDVFLAIDDLELVGYDSECAVPCHRDPFATLSQRRAGE